ncbi:MAG TPA: phosphate acyltransferase PlsX [Thermotogota bacterium]|nr:phosphate acyltransferase PlsX [Thermotogota bacterium]HPR95392.1 phosphate acyltransferase PlsX [Thermotogota bacterium]
MSIIAIDAMGGDHAPEEVIKGVVEAKKNGLKSAIALVGIESEIKRFQEMISPFNDIEIVNADDVFEMDAKPSTVLRRRDCSLYKAADLVKQGKADALVSAGSTGGLLAVATFVVGRIKGIPRPTIATPIPSKRGTTIFLDSGANLECKIENYVSFAKMGMALQKMNGLSRPKVGLLNVGTEEDKGTEAVKEALKALEENIPDNFEGFVEGRDITIGEVDVVVTDGWSGNIALKSMEGLGKLINSILKDSILSGGLFLKLGYLLLRPVFDSLRKKTDSRNTGGAYILGVNAPVVKAHGNSDALAFSNALRVAERGITEKLVQNTIDLIN